MRNLVLKSLTNCNHDKQGFAITPSKILYSFIEFQVLPCVPVHTHAVYLHLAFIAPSQSDAYLESIQISAMELFS